MAAAIPARAVAVPRHRPDELTAAADVCRRTVLCDLLGANDHLFVHRLPDGLGGKDGLLQQHAVGIVDVLHGDAAQAVLALLQGLGGPLGVLVGLGGLGAEGDLLLPRLHLGDADFQQSLLLGHDQLVALLDIGILGQGSTLEIRIQGTQLPEGQVVLLGNVPQGIARPDRIDLLLLLHAGQHILDGIVILKAVVEIDSIFQRHIFVKAHADILVRLILVGGQQALQIAAQGVAIGADCRQLPIQIQSGALTDLVTGALQNGVCRLALVHGLVSHGDGIGRLDGQLGLVRTGVVDALHHILFCEVEHFLIGHIANGLAVHLHSQRIGLGHGPVPDRDEHGQHTQGQDVHCCPGQQAQVALEPAHKIAPGRFYGSAKAPLPAHIVGVARHSAEALEEQVKRCQQILEHLRRTGKGCCNDGMQGIPAPAGQSAGHSSNTAPCAHHHVLCRKAQYIKCLANCQHHGTGPQLFGHIIHVPLRFAAETVPPQQAGDLDLCPEASQFFSALHRRCRSLALRLLCFFFDQKGLLLPDVLGRKLQIHINYTPCPG